MGQINKKHLTEEKYNASKHLKALNLTRLRKTNIKAVVEYQFYPSDWQKFCVKL